MDIIPCSSKNACDHGAPIASREYYDLSIESVCADKPDSFWHNKLVAIEVDVTIGSNPTIKVPVFKDRVGTGCHIGANGMALVTTVPNDGNGVTIQSSIYRSNDSDGLKKILSLATSTSQKPTLTNYAASAMPYVGMAVDFVNSAYSAFGQATTPWLNESPSRLHPVSQQYDRYDLREGYLVQYAGPDNPHDDDLYVDSGELYWKTGGSALRAGGVWILFKVRRVPRRTNYTDSTWYKKWNQLLTDCYQGSCDVSSFKTRSQQALALLAADTDYTSGDRDQYVKDCTTVEEQVITSLQKTPPDYNAVRQSIDASRSPVLPAGTVVSGVTTDQPTSSTNLGLAIVPSRLANQLTRMNANQ
ncbi:MAG TPA: hypothetical protein VI488_08520 [Candidatus Angelobacter sp.]